ncbi:MAG: non-ribosomal peptide synthetase, partial [Oscillochloris sp.]|nr:non-ribosomal peptide synthetase [Oscillochloris sp.]
SLDAWPLTPNGKVDRKALPAPAGSLVFASADFAAPRTPSEDLMAWMWVEILSLPRISRTDNFFELGGHSLLATRLLSRLRETFQVELPMRAIFETANLAELASRIDALRQEHAGLLAPAIMPVARNGDLPLSFAQQRLWFLDQLEPGSPLYNNFSAVRLAGSLDLDALESSLIALVQRHESLRTVFASRDGLPVQIIQPAESLVLTVPLIDLCAVAEDALDAEIERHIRREAAAPIDLANGPLLRLQLLRLADQEHIALLTVHHIISDGWSMGVFVGELFALYAEATGGLPAQLTALRVHYADFAAWQRAWLQGAVLEQQLAFWKQQLSDMPTLLELPTDRPRPPVQSFRGGHQPFAFSAEQTQALHRLSRQEQSTLFIVVLAAFQSLLYRYSGQERFGIGTPIANRTRAEIEPLIGFFVNTLVFSADLRGAPSFRELLRRVRETALGAYAHQDLPFEMLVEALQPERSLAYAPLFQVMFVMNNTPVQARQLPDLLISPVQVESGLARFDMTLELWDAPEGLAGSLEYNADLFDPATIERMLGHFATLLEAVCVAPDQPVTRLPLLSPAEQQQLTVGWNQTTVPFPADLCAHQMIAQWAAVQPDQLAAMMDGGST